MVNNVICAKNTLWLWSSQIFMMTQNTQKRSCWHCNIWPDYFFPTNHITVYMTWQWHIGVYEEMFDVNRTIAQTMQNIWEVIVGKLILPKKIMANSGDYPGDTVQNLESPGLKGGVDSTAHYYLVYKLKTNLCVSLTHCEREGNNSN